MGGNSMLSSPNKGFNRTPVSSATAEPNWLSGGAGQPNRYRATFGSAANVRYCPISDGSPELTETPKRYWFTKKFRSTKLDYSTVGGIVAVIIVIIVAVSYSKKKKSDE